MCIRKHQVGAFLLFVLFSVLGRADGPTQLFWGDTHLHTLYSPDAFMNGNMTTGPDEAYRFAKGMPVLHPYYKAWVRLDRPLDFLVVSDHAEVFGSTQAMYYGRDNGDIGWIERIRRMVAGWYLRKLVRDGNADNEFNHTLPLAQEIEGDPIANYPNSNLMQNFEMIGDVADISEIVWKKVATIADTHYQPGVFTTFIGWEWTSMPQGANLHRVVFTSGDAKAAAKFLPYSAIDSQYPTDLWAWLDETAEQTGAPFIAIPHNSNISRGYMFTETTLKGEKITPDYARLRARYEPVVEVTQVKGDSETWPTLSPDDPFSSFEPYPFYLQGGIPSEYEAKEGDFVRSALKRGLEVEENVGVNPYKFGLIGSTDSHTGLSSFDSDNFLGKYPSDSIPELKSNRETFASIGWDFSASGIAAVWAEKNTREAIFAAFKRREVYASTGPRIALRVFGGYDFNDDLANSETFVTQGYKQGVPMGADLLGGNNKPVKLAIRATRDPQGANLDQLHVVKGWIDADGKAKEKVYAVAWSGDRELAENGFPTPLGNTVDTRTARYTNSIGEGELAVVWTDPDFKADQRAFYYVRVLEIPTPRHSLYDTVAMDLPQVPEAGPASIQERAYSSPIWGPRDFASKYCKSL